MDPPKVTVLLPFRDAAETLDECLESILDQTLAEFELVAVDDGSRDGSAAILARRADPRIRLLSADGTGLVAALNQGLAAARAPLVARMDADDRMHRRRLERQSGYMWANPRLDVVGCRVRMFPAGAVRAGMREYMRWQNSCLAPESIADAIYVESPLVHPSVMFHVAAVMSVGGYRDGPFPEDYDLWLRLVQTGRRIGKVADTLLDWRQFEGSLSKRDPRYARSAFDQLRATYLAREPRLQRRPIAYWGAGRKTRQRSRLLIEKGFPAAVWVDIDPRKIGGRLNGVPVVSPQWLGAHATARPKPFVLGYVTTHGAHAQIAQQLEALGYRRGHDYFMVG